MSEPSTIVEALDRARETGVGQLRFHLKDEVTQITWADLAAGAAARAAYLHARGIGRGATVGILGPNEPGWALWAHAIWRAGATLVPLGYPLRIRDADALREQLLSLITVADCHVVLAPERMLHLLPEDVAVDWDIPLEPADEGTAGVGPSAPNPDDLAVIQYTSGSTSAPRGTMITHRATMEACWILRRGFDLTSGVDSLLGWTPLFHDLGLFTNVALPVAAMVDCEILPTERFAKNPALWLRVASETEATSLIGPSSAMAVTLRLAQRKPEGIDLGSVRTLALAAEAIDPEVADALTEIGGRMGLRPSAVQGGYGLAENTLTVSGGYRDRAMRILEVDATVLARDGRVIPATDGPVRRLPDSGRVVPPIEVRIGDANHDALPDDEVGEVLVKGPSLMLGYRGVEEQPFVDGWLRTGDKGFLHDGDLYIVGRIKELVIMQGRNYAPEEIEWAANRSGAVRTCVAFARPERDGELILVVEPASTEGVPQTRELARDAVVDALGITPAEVLAVPQGTITRTTSGKVRRTAVRDAYLSGDLQQLPE